MEPTTCIQNTKARFTKLSKPKESNAEFFSFLSCVLVLQDVIKTADTPKLLHTNCLFTIFALYVGEPFFTCFRIESALIHMRKAGAPV